MKPRMTRMEKCQAGRHTPVPARRERDGDVDRGVCRYCRRSIMRTQATRIWFLTAVLA